MRRKKKGEKLSIIRRISLTIKKVEELQTFGIVLKTSITGMACLIGFFVINFQSSMFAEFLNRVKEKIFVLPTEVVENEKTKNENNCQDLVELKLQKVLLDIEETNKKAKVNRKIANNFVQKSIKDPNLRTIVKEWRSKADLLNDAAIEIKKNYEMIQKKKINWKKYLVATIVFYEKSAEKGNKRAQRKIKKAFKAT